MGSYAAATFAKAAKKLPAGLVVQLRKQLKITPEQFLADGQAGADAGKVIAALRADGVTVYGAKLTGTALTVTVRDAAGAAAAQAAGASAVIGTAEPVKTVKAKALSSPADGTSHLLGGDLWFYLTDTSGDGVECSTGFNGYNPGTGAREFITAGHCADYQDTGDAAPLNGAVYAATDEKPVTYDSGVPAQTPSLGSLNQSSFQFGGGVDSGVVNVTDAKATPAPAVNTWGSGDTNVDSTSTASQGVENSGGTVPVLAAAAAFSGEPVCHSGATTGWQCGVVDNGDYSYVEAQLQVATGTQVVDGFDTSVCDLPGDSGGSFVSGEYAVGMASASSFSPQSSSGPGSNSCAAGGDTVAYPMVAAVDGEESADQSAQGFELAVSVPAPVVSTATADLFTGAGTISGYLPRPFATGTAVSLTLDGHQTASTTADSSGNWSFSLSGLADGAHSYTVTAGSSHSTAAKSGTLSVGQVTVSGSAQVGKTLTAGVTGVPSDGTVAYQWNVNGAAAATGGTYLIPASAVGKALTVTATVTEGGNSVSLTSGQTTIAPGTITSVAAPRVTGAVRVGARVVAYPGTWSVAGTTYTFQWLANGAGISGATGAAYVVPASLVGRQLSVAVTAHEAGYSNAAKTSAAVLVGKGILTATVKPKLSGTPAVGKRLAVTAGTWSPAAGIKIQWYANGRPVARATATSLLLPAALRGQAISVTVTAIKAGYATAVVRLAETTKVR
jgi:hypothetical protein